MGFFNRLSAAVFFSPFLAAITNHRILGSNHSSFILMLPFVPICEAVVVNSGHNINSEFKSLTKELCGDANVLAA